MIMSNANFNALVESLPQAKFVDGADLLWELRKIKSPREIECMRKVTAATTAAFETGFAAMREGMELLALGDLVTAPLVTEFPMGEIQHAFELLDKGQEELFKGVIRMEDE